MSDLLDPTSSLGEGKLGLGEGKLGLGEAMSALGDPTLGLREGKDGTGSVRDLLSRYWLLTELQVAHAPRTEPALDRLFGGLF